MKSVPTAGRPAGRPAAHTQDFPLIQYELARSLRSLARNKASVYVLLPFALCYHRLIHLNLFIDEYMYMHMYVAVNHDFSPLAGTSPISLTTASTVRVRWVTRWGTRFCVSTAATRAGPSGSPPRTGAGMARVDTRGRGRATSRINRYRRWLRVRGVNYRRECFVMHVPIRITDFGLLPLISCLYVVY